MAEAYFVEFPSGVGVLHEYARRFDQKYETLNHAFCSTFFDSCNLIHVGEELEACGPLVLDHVGKTYAAAERLFYLKHPGLAEFYGYLEQKGGCKRVQTVSSTAAKNLIGIVLEHMARRDSLKEVQNRLQQELMKAVR